MFFSFSPSMFSLLPGDNLSPGKQRAHDASRVPELHAVLVDLGEVVQGEIPLVKEVGGIGKSCHKAAIKRCLTVTSGLVFDFIFVVFSA